MEGAFVTSEALYHVTHLILDRMLLPNQWCLFSRLCVSLSFASISPSSSPFFTAYLKAVLFNIRNLQTKE